jgi:hypothetical protein
MYSYQITGLLSYKHQELANQSRPGRTNILVGENRKATVARRAAVFSASKLFILFYVFFLLPKIKVSICRYVLLTLTLCIKFDLLFYYNIPLIYIYIFLIISLSNGMCAINNKYVGYIYFSYNS